jgi:hypothetical protein
MLNLVFLVAHLHEMTSESQLDTVAQADPVVASSSSALPGMMLTCTLYMLFLLLLLFSTKFLSVLTSQLVPVNTIEITVAMEFNK